MLSGMLDVLCEPHPEEGAERIKNGFLFFKKTINGESRWWRRASWKERLVAVHQPVLSYLDWETVEWVD